ncbi:hypothetical protein MPSEU_000161200 [Mayamaea pseudoterrestris]|nr:hypothetical protein MPSEU_000161200 [Mayamaea pseudoterrestris]
MNSNRNKSDDHSPSSSASSGSGCPVNHQHATSTWPWASAASSKITSRPIDASDKQQQPPPALSYQPASIEEAAQHAQTPQPDQRVKLGTERQVSSIPRGDLNVNINGSPSTGCPMSADSAAAPQLPHHQHDDPSKASNWVYPSEQQLYNAMRRKGWTNVPEDSISTVLNIHNTINERTWTMIQQWEGSSNLTLTKFQGRPTEPSPKSWILCNLLRLYDAPFDRHDWYVAKRSSDGTESLRTQRYVIDYYYAESSLPDVPPRPVIDARPALDHPRAVYLRGKQFFKDAFPAISRRLFESTTDTSSKNDGVKT